MIQMYTNAARARKTRPQSATGGRGARRLYELATVSKQQPSHEIKRPLYKTTICADRINTEMRLQSKHYIDIRDDTQLANVSNYYIVIIFVCISH